MNNFTPETLRLIDSIPVPGDRSEFQVGGECPLAFDASGTHGRVFDVAAMDKAVARALLFGESYVSIVTQQRVAREAQFNDVPRVGEHIACLLKRANGKCVQYDAVNNRERTQEEARVFLRSNS